MEREVQAIGIRSIQVIGERVRFYRNRNGWTQEDLAKKAGYSDRLIRKAEHGGILTRETIENLAEALSTSDLQLEAMDLCRSPRSTQQLFLKIILEPFEAGPIEKLLFNESSLECDCKNEGIPFSGLFEGHEAIAQWITSFNSCVVRSETRSHDVLSIVDGNDGFLHTQLRFCWRSQLSSFIEFGFRIHFEEGLIRSVFVSPDNLALKKFFESADSAHDDGLEDSSQYVAAGHP